MKKIKCLFQRDPVPGALVRDEINPEAQWVADGEGYATRKYDGTCCMIRDGKLYKRREIKSGQNKPADWEPADGVDPQTGKQMGWVPVDDSNADRRHRAAFAWLEDKADGTYELCGPDVSRNPERFAAHVLVPHATAERLDAPRSYEGLASWLADQDIEGIVWHHPDGRMIKIGKKDFGLKRASRFEGAA